MNILHISILIYLERDTICMYILVLFQLLFAKTAVLVAVVRQIL